MSHQTERLLQHEKIKCMVSDCTLSFAEAIQQAGGTISDRMLDMSVREFIATVGAQNNIKFVFVKPEYRD